MKKNLSPQALREDITRFLMEHKDAALGTCLDLKPRTSPVQYFLGEELEIYILSAGGEKFEAIKANPNVCLLVNTEFITYRRIKGVQIFGRATTSQEDHHLLEEAMRYSPMESSMNIDQEQLKAIKIIPEEIVYLDAIESGDRTKQVLADNEVRIKEDNIMLH